MIENDLQCEDPHLVETFGDFKIEIGNQKTLKIGARRAGKANIDLLKQRLLIGPSKIGKSEQVRGNYISMLSAAAMRGKTQLVTRLLEDYLINGDPTSIKPTGLFPTIDHEVDGEVKRCFHASDPGELDGHNVEYWSANDFGDEGILKKYPILCKRLSAYGFTTD